jgi:hypothetical protein
VVIDMDSEARKAAFAAAKAESIETLDRVAGVEVVYRDHDDDALMRWRAGMPKKPAPPTMAEIEELVASKIARLPTALTSDETEALVASKIAALLVQHRELQYDVIGAALSHERKRVAAEFDKLRNELGELRADITVAKAADVERTEAEVIGLMRRGQRRA